MDLGLVPPTPAQFALLGPGLPINSLGLNPGWSLSKWLRLQSRLVPWFSLLPRGEGECPDVSPPSCPSLPSPSLGPSFEDGSDDSTHLTSCLRAIQRKEPRDPWPSVWKMLTVPSTTQGPLPTEAAPSVNHAPEHLCQHQDTHSQSSRSPPALGPALALPPPPR